MRFIVQCRRDTGVDPETVAEFSEPGYESLELARLLTQAKGVLSVAVLLQPETVLMKTHNGEFEHVGED